MCERAVEGGTLLTGVKVKMRCCADEGGDTDDKKSHNWNCLAETKWMRRVEVEYRRFERVRMQRLVSARMERRI